MGETHNIMDQNPEQGMALTNELENWLSSTGARIPEIDPLHDGKEEKEWLNNYKQKMKSKVEKRRTFQLSPNYLPNEDWWGSTID